MRKAGDFLGVMVENRPVGAARKPSGPGVNRQNSPIQRTQSRPSFQICPVCGIPAPGASYGIHDECAPIGYLKGLAGDFIDSMFGRQPIPRQEPRRARVIPIKINPACVQRPAAHTVKYVRNAEVIKDAEFRVIDKKGKA
jgi:hypothetical protein